MRTILLTAASIAVATFHLAAQGAITAPCFEPSFGANLNLTDDSVAQGLPLGFTFPAPGGASVNTIDVSSNGFVWLSSNPDSGCCDGDETKFLSRGPRIAPLWVDLDPSSGGAVWFNALPAVGTIPAHVVVTWADVPEFQGQSSLTFQLQMFDDGSVLMFFDPNAGITNHRALTGLTQGNGAAANFIDLSQTGAVPHDSGTNPTAYEQHFFGFDLAASAYTFVPNGQGGYVVTEKTGCPFATVTPFGNGCPKPVTTYELFNQANPIDLSNTALEFIPSGTGGYVAAAVPGFFTGYTNLQVFGDDDSQGPFNLPFTFNYPGGSTNAIDISSNGFVWLQSGNPDSRCCDGNAFGFIGDAASIAVLWQDLYPPGAQGNGGIYFDVVGTTEAHITWVDVPEFLNQGANTCQLTLRNDGSFRLSWGNVANFSHDVLVGFSEGFGTADPGSTDFSTGAFVTGVGGTPLRLLGQMGSRPALGSTFTMEVDQLTTGSVFGVMVFGLSAFPGGLDLSGLGMPGCQLYASLDALLSFPLAGTPTLYSFSVPSTASLAGLVITAQAATLTPGATPLGLLSSNGLSLVIGL